MRVCPAEVAKEYRVSLVMYGGVSLAIYMNGITQELLRMVRSTARTTVDGHQVYRFDAPPAPTGPGVSPEGPKGTLSSTEAVYRELARELNQRGADDVRFIIDTIAGSSAGGINAIFLAKALTDDSLGFDALQDLWVEEAGLDRLLNDRETRKDTRLPVETEPSSLLSGDRMYVKLLDAFGLMGNGSAPGEPLADEIDLFATTTDIHGRVIPLRLSDRLIWERRYRQDFHLRFVKPANGDGCRGANDFVVENNPLLAFVARSTSSFPFAFEPMQLARVRELAGTGAWPESARGQQGLESFSSWERFFDNSSQLYTGSNVERVFGDGGLLDNKPFSYVIRMLGRHDSPYPAERKLIFVEPAPEHPEREAAGDAAAEKAGTNVPNAVQISFDAIVKLRAAQPIHDELERVTERNRLVRKVETMAEMITAEIYPGYAGTAAERSRRAAPGIGEFTYLVTRVHAATDELATVIAQWFEVDDTSSFWYAVRCLVRAWAEERFERGRQGQDLAEGLRAFLEGYDLEYWRRCYRFVSQQIDSFYEMDDEARRRLEPLHVHLSGGEEAGFRQALIEAKKVFNRAHRIIGDGPLAVRPTAGASGVIRAQAGGRAKPGAQSVIDYVLGTEPWENTLEAPPPGPANACSGEEQRELIAALLPLRKRVDDFKTRHEAGELHGPDGSQSTRRRVTSPLAATDDEDYMRRARSAIPHLGAEIEAFAGEISTRLNDARRSARQVVQDAWEEWGREADADCGRREAFRIIRFFYDCFEQFDTGIFPLTCGTDVSTPEQIAVVRISPDDAVSIYDHEPRSRKLAGSCDAYFGAFFDRSWRRTDLLWGRLDGAERIIQGMMAGARMETGERVRRETELISEAHRIILEEYLAEQRATPAGPAGETLFDRGADIRTVEQLRQHLGEVPPAWVPPRRFALESFARSVGILGAMLKTMNAGTRDAGSCLGVLGSLFKMVVAGTAPGFAAGGHWLCRAPLLLGPAAVISVGGWLILIRRDLVLGIGLLAVPALVWLGLRALRRRLWGTGQQWQQ